MSVSENGVYSIVKYNQDNNTNYNGFDRVFVSINGETLKGYPIRQNGTVYVSDMIDDDVIGISRESYFDVEVVPTSGSNILKQSNKDVFISYRKNQLESSIEIIPDQGYDTLDKVTVDWNYGRLGNNGDDVLINTTKGAAQNYGNNGNIVRFGTNWFNDPENDNSVTNTQDLFYGFPSENSDIIGITEFTLKGKIENKTITQNGTYYPYDSSTIIKKIIVDVPQSSLLEFSVTKFNIGFLNGNPGGGSRPNPTWEDISVDINSNNFKIVNSGDYYPEWTMRSFYDSLIVIIVELDIVNGLFKLIPIFFTTKYSDSDSFPVHIVNDSGVDKIWYIHKEYVGTYYESENSVKNACKFRNCDLVYDTDKIIFGNTDNEVYDFYNSNSNTVYYNTYKNHFYPDDGVYIKNYSGCTKYYTIGKINPSLINFPNL